MQCAFILVDIRPTLNNVYFLRVTLEPIPKRLVSI